MCFPFCQLFTKGGPAGKLMWCDPPWDHLDYRRRYNIQRSSPQNTGRAKTVTTPRLDESDFGHALGARTFYTSPLRKCQKTYRKTSLKFIRLLRVVFSSQQRLNRPAVNAVQWRHSLPENRVVILIGWLSKHAHNYVYLWKILTWLSLDIQRIACLAFFRVVQTFQ